MGVLEHKVTSVAVSDTAGTVELVAAATGKITVVTDISLSVADADASAQFKSATTALTGAMTFEWFDNRQNARLNMSNTDGVLATASGEALSITVGGGGTVNGWVTYYQVTA